MRISFMHFNNNKIFMILNVRDTANVMNGDNKDLGLELSFEVAC
jgi:hypothetical protein